MFDEDALVVNEDLPQMISKLIDFFAGFLRQRFPCGRVDSIGLCAHGVERIALNEYTGKASVRMAKYRGIRLV